MFQLHSPCTGRAVQIATLLNGFTPVRLSVEVGMSAARTNGMVAIVSVAVVDALNSLIDTEQNSIFRAMGEDSPYVRNAPLKVRGVLHEEHEASYRNADELARLVRQMGGQPVERVRTAPHPPLLEFISLKFLLPKLCEEKELIIRFYEK